jgi:hypothetical protein
VLQQDIQDTFAWRWSASRVYLASSACTVLNLGQTLLLGAKEMWRTKAAMEVKFFLWLALQDRCWTSERLQIRQQWSVRDLMSL